MFAVDQYLCSVGGNTNALRKFQCFDNLLNVPFVTSLYLTDIRSDITATVTQKGVVLLGGGVNQTTSTTYAQVEMVDFYTGTHTFHTLSQARLKMKAATCVEISGFGGGFLLASTTTRSPNYDFYNSTSNTWTSIIAGVAHSYSDAKAVADKIVFVGGSTVSAFAFNPFIDVYHTTNASFTSIPLFLFDNSESEELQAAAFGGKLYIISPGPFANVYNPTSGGVELSFSTSASSGGVPQFAIAFGNWLISAISGEIFIYDFNTGVNGYTSTVTTVNSFTPGMKNIPDTPGAYAATQTSIAWASTTLSATAVGMLRLELDRNASAVCNCAGTGFRGNTCQFNITECVVNPCLNGGTCTPGVGVELCTCVTGYSGNRCQTVIDQCASHPCIFSTCTSHVGFYTCACPAGMTGAQCQTTIDACASSPCGFGATCIPGVNSYSCACMTCQNTTVPGYTVNILAAPTPFDVPAYIFGGAGITAASASIVYGGLSDFPSDATAITGFVGFSSSNGATATGPPLTGTAGTPIYTAFHALSVYATAQGSTNILSGSTFTMNGQRFYPGVYLIGSSLQLNTAPNGTCGVILDAQGNCSAKFIFNIGSTFTTATSSYICLTNGTEPDSVVWNVGSSLSVGTSTIGWGIVVAQASITFAASGTWYGQMAALSASIALNGAFSTITANYTRNATCAVLGTTLVPTTVTPAQLTCASPGGTCVPNSLNCATPCNCTAGYSGYLCQTNVNECASNPCANGGSCTDGVNRFTCTCTSGFSGTRCQTNVDECANAPCLNGGTCADAVNSFTCTCPPGIAGDFCQTAPCGAWTLELHELQVYWVLTVPGSTIVPYSLVALPNAILPDIGGDHCHGLAWDLGVTKLYTFCVVALVNSLVQIDPISGIGTVIGRSDQATCMKAVGHDEAVVEGVHVNPETGILFVSASLENQSPRTGCLVTVNLTTGVSTDVGNMGTVVAPGSIWFSPISPGIPTVLYRTQNGVVYTVNQATAATTVFSTLTFVGVPGCNDALVPPNPFTNNLVSISPSFGGVVVAIAQCVPLAEAFYGTFTLAATGSQFSFQHNTTFGTTGAAGISFHTSVNLCLDGASCNANGACNCAAGFDGLLCQLTDCPAGRYANTTTLDVCALCAAGKSQAAIGQTACVNCAAGSFQANTGATSCPACPINSRQPFAGSTSCSPCLSGTNGTNCADNINACASSPCKNNAQCVNGVNAFACRCTAGFFGVTCQTSTSSSTGGGAAAAATSPSSTAGVSSTGVNTTAAAAASAAAASTTLSTGAVAGIAVAGMVVLGAGFGLIYAMCTVPAAAGAISGSGPGSYNNYTYQSMTRLAGTDSRQQRSRVHGIYGHE